MRVSTERHRKYETKLPLIPQDGTVTAAAAAVPLMQKKIVQKRSFEEKHSIYP